MYESRSAADEPKRRKLDLSPTTSALPEVSLEQIEGLCRPSTRALAQMLLAARAVAPLLYNSDNHSISTTVTAGKDDPTTYSVCIAYERQHITGARCSCRADVPKDGSYWYRSSISYLLTPSFTSQHICAVLLSLENKQTRVTPREALAASISKLPRKVVCISIR